MTSCVALAVHIPVLEIAALLRFSLPDPEICSIEHTKGRWLYGSTAIPLLFSRIEAHGVSREDVSVWAIGGSDVFSESGIGSQNVRALRKILRQESITLQGEDLGGTLVRSLWFNPEGGRLIVRMRQNPDASAVGESGASLQTKAS
ncbi:MAG: chemotaxis protein CheD [Acidobacteriaceae bacterium]|nr:chemotaxis protein CheD [Acidobacteriaceae bacterium]